MRNDHSHNPHNPPQGDLLRELGYEAQDVDAKGLLRWLVFLGVFLAVMAAIAFGVYKLFIPSSQAEVVAPTSLPMQAQILPPPNYPLLQVDPREELIDFRRKEDAQLDHYGWVDKKKNIVHIPIERAMDLTAQDAQKLLPVRTSQEAEQSEKE